MHSALLGLINPFIYYLILLKAYQLLPAQVAQPLNMIWPIILVFLSIPLLGQKIKGKRGFFIDGEKIAEGKDDLEHQINSDAKLRRTLLKASQVNTISNTKKKLEKLSEQGINRYPVNIKAPRKTANNDEE